jgi:uncharacterized protein involved in response to NO
MPQLAYIFICITLITKSLSHAYTVLLINRASIHLILAGGASMSMVLILIWLAVGNIKGATLINKSTKAIIICIILGALIRFLVPVINPAYFHKSLHHSMGIWTMAYLVFFFKYTMALLNLKTANLIEN